MGKQSKIDVFLKRKLTDSSKVNSSISPSNVAASNDEGHPKKSRTVEVEETQESIANKMERDPGLRQQLSMYEPDQRDKIRRAYIEAGPYQCELKDYPMSGPISHPRRFQSSWFKIYPSWLEYSPTKDAAYCLPCFLFYNPDTMQSAFVVEGFRNWKKVRDGKLCAFLVHVGKNPNSGHKKAEKTWEDLMNQHQHLPQMLDKHNSQQIENNRLRLQTSIDAVQYLTLQGCALRGHDESKFSNNRGNFLEYLKRIKRYNEKVAEVMDKAPKNATYTSPDIQKEILQVMSTKIKKVIREEIGDAKFCIIVDEAHDQSKREQMTLVLRFVDHGGFIQERFFGVVHVRDTKALTLKNAIFSVLSHHNLDVQSIRGQGYDGASNMRGKWNGLQELIAKECPQAYYVHCLAHRLQLALVAASRDVKPVHKFFGQLAFIINAVDSSSKRHDELQVAQAEEIAHLISQNEL